MGNNLWGYGSAMLGQSLRLLRHATCNEVIAATYSATRSSAKSRS